jgi:hypothetical protein
MVKSLKFVICHIKKLDFPNFAILIANQVYRQNSIQKYLN